MDDGDISLDELLNRPLPSGTEAEQALHAIVLGDADAIVVHGRNGPRVYTLTDAGEPYRLLVEQMSEAALILAEDGTILYSNGRLDTLLGHPPITGLTLPGLVAATARPRAEPLLADGLARRVVDELPLRTAGGGELAVRLAASPMVFDGRPAITVVATPLDEIAALKAANERIETINDGLEQQVRIRTRQLAQAQKLEVIGRMTGGVAHDFNNVLQGLGSCLAVLDGHIRDGKARAVFDAAQQSIERGARLTGALLAVAKRQTLTPEPVDMRQLFEDLRPLLDHMLGGLIAVVIGPAPAEWVALADRAQLESAILNLAINARDAMPEGGTLTLRTSMEAIGTDRRLAPGHYLSITVTDTGTGMDAETLAQACDPFFTTKDWGKGTGLGLSTVLGMAEQSGGGLRIDSRPGDGTKITLILPAVAAPTANAAPPAAPPPTAAGGATLLVVDDDDLVRTGLEMTLSDLGYRVLTAHSGKAALEILRQSEPVDVLLTDFAMPEMNGATLTEAARRLRADLPVILMTGYADAPSAMESVTRLHKPFSLKDLAAKLAGVLPG